VRLYCLIQIYSPYWKRNKCNWLTAHLRYNKPVRPFIWSNYKKISADVFSLHLFQICTTNPPLAASTVCGGTHIPLQNSVSESRVIFP
jgi:hypothetical protein